MPSSSVRLKSSESMNTRAMCRMCRPGRSLEATITAADRIAPIIVRPIDCGRRVSRALRVENSAARTTTMAAASKAEKGIAAVPA